MSMETRLASHTRAVTAAPRAAGTACPETWRIEQGFAWTDPCARLDQTRALVRLQPGATWL